MVYVSLLSYKIKFCTRKFVKTYSEINQAMAEAGNELCFGFVLFRNTLMHPLKSADINT